MKKTAILILNFIWIERVWEYFEIAKERIVK